MSGDANGLTGLPIKSFATPLNLPPTEQDIPKNSRLFKKDCFGEMPDYGSLS